MRLPSCVHWIQPSCFVYHSLSSNVWVEIRLYSTFWSCCIDSWCINNVLTDMFSREVKKSDVLEPLKVSLTKLQTVCNVSKLRRRVTKPRIESMFRSFCCQQQPCLSPQRMKKVKPLMMCNKRVCTRSERNVKNIQLCSGNAAVFNNTWEIFFIELY